MPNSSRPLLLRVWALCGLALALAFIGCAAPDAGSAGTVAGLPEYRVRGAGQPVVVFQSGLGDGLRVWDPVQSSLDPALASVAYSRPGYGRTPWVEQERSPCEVARKQHLFLRAAGLEPPYLLVGHSIGGLYQFAFAKLYPQQVAGLLLLDPTHPDHWPSLQRDAPAVAMLVGAARAAFSAPMKREFDDQTACREQLRALPMPRLPTRLLVREQFKGFEAGAFESVVRRLEADWAQQTGAAVRRVAGAGHYIQRDQPQIVVSAIEELAAAARSR